MYEIPVTHPLVNHFAIALLIAAAGTALVWLIAGKAFWRLSTLLLVAGGFIGAIVATRTGETMKDFSRGRAVVKELVERHDQLAHLTIYLAGAALIVIGVYTIWLVRHKQISRAAESLIARIVGTLLVIAAAISVGYTGHLGGTMTWGEETSTNFASPGRSEMRRIPFSAESMKSLDQEIEHSSISEKS